MVYTRTLDQAPHLELADTAPKVIEATAQKIIEMLDAARRPEPGTVVPLYLRVTRTLHRARDVARIYRRTLELRQALLEEDRARRHPSLDSLPSPASAIDLSREKLAEQVRTDVECLYLIGNVALDEWACLAAHVFGWPRPLKVNFDNFRRMIDEERLPSELVPFAADILWLITQVRFYRNGFIVHVERPWQIGHTRSTEEYDFQLSAPALLASYDAEAMAQRVMAIAEKIGIPVVGATPRMLLPVLVDMVGEVRSKEIRQEIHECYSLYGALTPTFHEVGRGILEFLDVGTAALAIRVRNHPEAACML